MTMAIYDAITPSATLSSNPRSPYPLNWRLRIFGTALALAGPGGVS